MSYTEFTTLPDNVILFGPVTDVRTQEMRTKMQAEGKLVWSSTHAVPPIGSDVYVTIAYGLGGSRQQFKWCRVEGYFQEHGFFGLLCRPQMPPGDWAYKGHKHAHIFGIDIDFDRKTS